MPTIFFCIYIPIWLDLLFEKSYSHSLDYQDLHSNMVRFIIQSKVSIPRQYMIIYIPIWLDLLFNKTLIVPCGKCHLHSNMVRFIISQYDICPLGNNKFTFQYG